MGTRSEPGLWNRRGLLLTGLSGLTLSACACLPKPPDLKALISDRFIDVHCHVFRGNDIPVTEFLVHTALREKETPEPWISLAPFFTRLVEFYCRLIDPEKDATLQNAARLDAANERELAQTFRALLVQVVNDIAENSRATLAADYVATSELSIVQTARTRAPHMFELQTTRARYALNLEAASLVDLFARFKLPVSFAQIDRVAALAAGDFAIFSAFAAQDLNRLASKLNDASSQDSLDIGAILYVARLICSTRMSNIEQLDATLGMAADTNVQSRLYVPSLVDFDCWYQMGASDLSLSVDLQTRIMHKASLSQTDPNRFVHGYVPFDPLRQVLVDAKLLPGPRPIDTVCRAIRERGFIGVKLYPPMGYSPFNNAACDNDSFGLVAQSWIEKLKALVPHPDDYRFGQQLDDALHALYDYCLLEQVPIMAHCGNSQTSFPGSGACASPSHWLALLDSENGKYKALHLNLAHFGSLWCKLESMVPSTDPSSESKRCANADPWVNIIIDAITKRDGELPLYPNLYMDVSDMGDISLVAGAIGKLEVLFREKTADQKAAMAQRMLYGTDWIFLALYGSAHVSYIKDVWTVITDSGFSSHAIFADNARRFLGLEAGRNASRLRDFYAARPERSAGLEALLSSSGSRDQISTL